MEKIRVLLADDHAVLRSGLRLLIDTQSDMEVVGETGDHESALTKTIELRPDVLTLDLSMPGGLGTEAIQRIVDEVPSTRVLVLTMHDDAAYFRSAMAAGAFGYVVKKAADVELLDAIRAVAGGQVYSRFTPTKNVDHADQIHSDHSSLGQTLDILSDREREVLELVARGHTNQAVADLLSLSVKTIESYRSRLMTKLGLRNRAQLTQFAVETGLLQSPSRREKPMDET